MRREEFLVKLKYYEQAYFSNDEPVPFVGGLKIYPALVKDYYKLKYDTKTLKIKSEKKKK